MRGLSDLGLILTQSLTQLRFENLLRVIEVCLEAKQLALDLFINMVFPREDRNGRAEREVPMKTQLNQTGSLPVCHS